MERMAFEKIFSRRYPNNKWHDIRWNKTIASGFVSRSSMERSIAQLGLLKKKTPKIGLIVQDYYQL